MSSNIHEDNYLSFNEVSILTGNKSRTTIWRWCRDGLFPKPHKIGPNSSAWLSSEITEWKEKVAKNQREAIA